MLNSFCVCHYYYYYYYRLPYPFHSHSLSLCVVPTSQLTRTLVSVVEVCSQGAQSFGAIRPDYKDEITIIKNNTFTNFRLLLFWCAPDITLFLNESR